MRNNFMEETKKAYEEILELIKYHRDLVVFSLPDLVERSKDHLFGLELKEKYGFNIDPKEVRFSDYCRFGEHRFLGWYGEKYRRSIGWETNGKEIDGEELLFSLGFSTGAYIFSDDYPEKIFQEFFLELKSYNPKYIDEVNHCLYFTLDGAKDIFNNFPDILKKYQELNKIDFKKRKIAKLEKELESLNK